MNEVEKINNTDLTVKVHQGQRVVTFKDIDAVHERPEGTAKRNFSKNEKYFIEGEDFFTMPYSEFSTKFVQNPPKGGNPNVQVNLFTEQGYLMLVKSFTDDLAWKVQRQLVKSYFRKKEPKVICLADVEEKDPLIRLFKTENGGIVLLDDNVYSLTVDEIEMLSKFIPEMEKYSIGQVQYAVQAFLRSMKKSGRLEEIASWGIGKEEKKALPDKATQNHRSDKDENAPFITIAQSMNRYNLSRGKVMELAKEAGGYIKYGRAVRIEKKKVDEYLARQYAE